MLEPFQLDPIQRAAVDEMLADTSGGVLLAADTGTGKTLLALTYVEESKAKQVLVVAPLQTLGKNYGELAEYSEGWKGTHQQQQISIPFYQIDSTVSGKKALAALQWGAPGVYFVGHEMFCRMGWEKVQQFNRDKTPKKKFNQKTKVWEDVYKKVRTDVWDVTVDIIIFDEVHRAQSLDSVTFKTLRGGGLNGGKGNPKARMKRIGASGTFEGNGFGGAHPVTLWIWPTKIDASAAVWRSKWAETKYSPFKTGNIEVIGERDPGAFVSSLPCYIHIKADFDIEVIPETFFVDLYPEQRRVYDELEAKMVAWIEDNPMVVKFPITKRIRQRQATLGMPEVEYIEKEDGEIDIKVSFDLDCLSAKIDDPENGLFAVLEGFFEGEEALIYTDSQQFADVLTYRINKRYGGEVARSWHGKIPRKKRNEDKADFLNGRYKYMVAVIKAVGTGTDGLQRVAHNMLYVSSDDSMVEGKQSKARTIRRGQASKIVRVAWIIARGTIDEPQFVTLIDREIQANRRAKVRKRNG